MGHVACMEEMKSTHKLLVGKLKGSDNLGDRHVVWKKKILEWILGKRDRKVWIGCIWLRIET